VLAAPTNGTIHAQGVRPAEAGLLEARGLLNFHAVTSFPISAEGAGVALVWVPKLTE
jgi:hypothetical protein